MRGSKTVGGYWDAALVATVLLAAAVCFGCASGNGDAKSPDPESESDRGTANQAKSETPEAEPASEPKSTAEPQPAAEPEPAAEAAPPAPNEGKPEPRFTEGMSVNEAISAVPPGTEYFGLDADALGRPLADLSLYAPCKLNPSQHFKLQVAVYNGKAVGIDVTSNNKKLADCVKQQVSQVQWHDKVKSVNTVDYSY